MTGEAGEIEKEDERGEERKKKAPEWHEVERGVEERQERLRLPAYHNQLCVVWE